MYEGEGWYGELAVNYVYERLVDFRWRYLKYVRICGQSKRWWEADLSASVKAVRQARRRWVSCGNRNIFKVEVAKIKLLFREKKDCCWRSLCEDSGLRDPWEVVRLSRDPW